MTNTQENKECEKHSKHPCYDCFLDLLGNPPPEVQKAAKKYIEERSGIIGRSNKPKQMTQENKECCEKCLDCPDYPNTGGHNYCHDSNCPCHQQNQENNPFSLGSTAVPGYKITTANTAENQESEWGEELEELINNLRSNPSTDSVHLHEFVRLLLSKQKDSLVEQIEAVELDYGEECGELWCSADSKMKEKILALLKRD